jgi:hypothetical protein
MYFCAPYLARFFVLCQVYSSSRHLKSAPFAASLADLRPATLCRSRVPSTRRAAPRACFVSTLNKERGRAPALLVALRLGQCVNVRKGYPLNSMQRYCFFLIYANLFAYFFCKIGQIGDFCYRKNTSI